MSDDYGKRLMLALRAVQQLHADSSKLLLEIDRRMEGYTSIFGNFATRDLKYKVDSTRYMAEGIYRHYQARGSTVVPSFTVAFFDSRLDEPVIIVAETEYNSEGELRRICNGWDPWNMLLDWSGRWPTSDIVTTDAAQANGRIVAAQLLARPLFSIEKVDDVLSMLQRVQSR